MPSEQWGRCSAYQGIFFMRKITSIIETARVLASDVNGGVKTGHGAEQKSATMAAA